MKKILLLMMLLNTLLFSEGDITGIYGISPKHSIKNIMSILKDKLTGKEDVSFYVGFMEFYGFSLNSFDEELTTELSDTFSKINPRQYSLFGNNGGSSDANLFKIFKTENEYYLLRLTGETFGSFYVSPIYIKGVPFELSIKMDVASSSVSEDVARSFKNTVPRDLFKNYHLVTYKYKNMIIHLPYRLRSIALEVPRSGLPLLTEEKVSEVKNIFLNKYNKNKAVKIKESSQSIVIKEDTDNFNNKIDIRGLNNNSYFRIEYYFQYDLKNYSKKVVSDNIGNLHSGKADSSSDL